MWGVAGFALLLVYTILRLGPIALETFGHQLRWYHWLALLLNVSLMAYSEGYRGFQKSFSPRVVARARYLQQHPRLLAVLFAPLYCMGYFQTTRRRQRATFGLTIGIIVLVVLIRSLDQPWRGIIDAGVVVGLSWGLISLLFFSVQAVTAAEFDYSPEVPEEHVS